MFAAPRQLQQTVEESPLLQVDGLIMPRLVELCTPYLVHALVLGPTEGHRRPESDVKIAETFEGFDEFFGVELRAIAL
jgi:hypothetical protein